jgi:putative ABC transport system substrate-binding protein
MTRAVLIALIPPILVLSVLGCGKNRSGPSEQFVIGLVTNNPNGLENLRGFRERMTELGYREGKNVTYLFAGEPVNGEALDTEISRMVEAKVDLIFTAGTPTGVAAHRITQGTGVPVVFGVIADPVQAGVLSDLTNPGGNITGVRLSENQDRRLQFLLELAPSVRKVFVPYNPEDPAPGDAVAQISRVARGLGVEIVTGHARNDEEVTVLLQNVPNDVDAIFMLPDSTVNRRAAELNALAIERKLPLSGPSMIQVEQGALTAYGIIHKNAGAQAAEIAEQVLRGAAPGSLPVRTAEAYLGINLTTAEAIGLEIAPDLIQQAEFVVRAQE